MAAPATHHQPSRKGKRSWRKNIDIAQVSSGLESARDERRITGGESLLADAAPDTLFQTDLAGNVGIKRQAQKEHGTLKIDEILAQRSAVPAVGSKKRSADSKTTDGVLSKKQKANGGVSRQEYDRLRQVAYNPTSALPTEEDDRTLTTLSLHDPWAVTPASNPTPNTDFLPQPEQAKAPSTIHHPPIALTTGQKTPAHIPRPAKHTSYNPDFTDWLATYKAAEASEVAAEQSRLALAAEEAAHDAAVQKAGEAPEEPDPIAKEAEDVMSELESEWEGFASDVEGRDLRKKRPERKTPAERNKIKRRKEAEARERHERKERERDEGVRRFNGSKKERSVGKVDSAIASAASPSPSESESEDDEAAIGTTSTLKKRRFGQKQIPTQNLELVLPDELDSSLRRLKPEGNLLDDRFRNMIVQGRVEARPRPVGQQRQRRVKSTEKWGFKDWKVPA